MPITSYEDVKIKRAQIMQALQGVAHELDCLHEMGLNDLDVQEVLDVKDRLEKDNFKVLVIGEFKCGKSTFINALMGKKILPSYSTPCTAVINEVVYGRDEQATLYFKDKKKDADRPAFGAEMRPAAYPEISESGRDPADGYQCG